MQLNRNRIRGFRVIIDLAWRCPLPLSRLRLGPPSSAPIKPALLRPDRFLLHQAYRPGTIPPNTQVIDPEKELYYENHGVRSCGPAESGHAFAWAEGGRRHRPGFCRYF